MKLHWYGSFMLIAVFGANTLYGAAMSYEFSGVIDYEYDPDHLLDPPVPLGTMFSGQFTFDSSAEDTKPDPHNSSYAGPSFSMSVVIGPYSLFSGTGNGSIAVGNDNAGQDSLRLSASQFLSNNGLPMHMGVGLTDNTASVFSSDAMPIVPFSLAGLDNYYFLKGYGTNWALGGHLTSFTPEPASFLLILLALVLLPRASFADSH